MRSRSVGMNMESTLLIIGLFKLTMTTRPVKANTNTNTNTNTRTLLIL